MFRPLIAVLIAASPAALSAQATKNGDWSLEKGPQGCMVYATSPQGSVVSVSALAGQDSLSFLVQNRRWASLEEGPHDINVQFDSGRGFPMQAVARNDIDSDGPGLLFAVKPTGEAGGARFVEQFASASAMRISSEGEPVDSLSLSGAKAAMGALAQCIGQMASGADQEPERQPVLDTVAAVGI